MSLRSRKIPLYVIWVQFFFLTFLQSLNKYYKLRSQCGFHLRFWKKIWKCGGSIVLILLINPGWVIEASHIENYPWSQVFYKNLLEAESILFNSLWLYCVCVKRITLCNCLRSSSPSSRDFASVIRNIGKFGAKNYFTDHRTANTIYGFRDSVPVLKIHDCY